MRTLESVNVSLDASTPAKTYSLHFAKLDPNKVIRRAWIKSALVAVRGSGGIAHTRQACERTVGLITMIDKGQMIRMSGHTANILFALRNGVPNMCNPQSISTSGTSIITYHELPLSPPHPTEKLYRPLSEMIEGGVVDVQSSIDDFLNTATTGDICSATGTLELIAQFENKPKRHDGKDYQPIEPGGMWIQEQSDWQGETLNLGGKNVRLFQLLLKTRTNFTNLTLHAGGQLVYQAKTALDLDAMQAEHLPHHEADGTEMAAAAQGHPFLVAYPTVASEIASTDAWTVAFDARNQKDARGPLSLFAYGKGSNAIPYVAVGWQSL